LIFMRWSYRQSHGRSEELSRDTALEVTDDALVVRRGHITAYIGWAAISELRKGRSFLALIIDGSPTLLIPDHWFGKDTDQRQAFHDLLEARTQL